MHLMLIAAAEGGGGAGSASLLKLGEGRHGKVGRAQHCNPYSHMCHQHSTVALATKTCMAVAELQLNFTQTSSEEVRFQVALGWFAVLTAC